MNEEKKVSWWRRLHQKLVYAFHDSKFGHFWSKWHLQYLLLTGVMYGIKAGLYFLVAYIPSNPISFGYVSGNILTQESIHYSMAIDEAIPLVSYFYFFYLLYYIVPEIFLWILSFFDKKKMVTIVIAAITSTIIAVICFASQQVKMLRPEDELAYYDSFSKVDGLDALFKYGIHWQYGADETALNCIPSLHANVGMALAMVGLWTGKDEKHFPIGLRIFCSIFGFGIIMSTFFVKQHYFVDAITGAALFVIMYFLYKLLIVPHYLKRKALKEEKSQKLLEA